MNLKNLKNMLNGFKIDIKMLVGYIYPTQIILM